MVGLVGLEPTTPALSRRCSNQLSYRPFTQPKGGGDRDPAAAKAQEGAMLDQLTRMLRSTTADKSGRSISSAICGLGSSVASESASRFVDAVRRCHFPE